MQLKIDGPVVVRVRPASSDRRASVVLDILGGSLWFREGDYPSNLQPGTRKAALVEVEQATARIGDSQRTVFIPSRLVEVQ